MFESKVVTITGGSSGVGKALAERLVKKGAHLALVARDEKKLESVRESLKKIASPDQKIEAFSCDVSNPDACVSTMNNIAESTGSPDILINSAGILKESYFENQSIETFRNVMDINFFGTLHCIKAVLPYFKKKGDGRIVNISSVAGLMGVFGYAAYCASKHAIVGLSGSLRSELLHQNINVHVVCPPEFESPMVDELNTYRTVENREVVQTVPVLGVDVVADAIIEGIEKNKYEIIPGFLTRMVERSNRWFPSIGRAVADSRVRKCYKGPDN